MAGVANSEAAKIVRHFAALEDGRRHFDNHWQEVADHSLARRDFIALHEPGRQRNVRIYDSTSQHSNLMLGAALHSMLTNPATNWFELRYGDPTLNDIPEASEYLDVVKRRLQIAFNRPASGFSTQIAQFWEDLPGFGNACMYVEEDASFGARFVARPISELWIDTDEAGKVVAIYRAFSLRRWQAKEEYGDELPDHVNTEDDSKDAERKFEFLHVVRKNKMPLPGKLDASGMAWQSITILKKSKEVVRQKGFHTNPYMYGRWSVDTGESHGRGPGLWSLPDQKMLNSMWRTYIRGSEKAVDPPVMVDNDSVIGGSQLRITPSATIVVTPDLGTGREPVRYLENRSQPQWVHEIMESRAKKVEKTFHSEVIQAFLDPRMTATQVLELVQLAQRQLSPMLGRVQEDALDPMIQRVFDIESRRTDFPQPPEELRDAEILIEYVGPVARAQKAAEAQAILDTWAALQAIAQSEPNVLDNFDTDEAARGIAEGNGIPQRVLRLPDEVQSIREQRAAAEENEKMEQELVTGGETVAKLLPGIAKLNEAQGGALPN